MRRISVTQGGVAIGAIAVLENNPNGMRADQYEALMLAMLAADGHEDPGAVLAAVRSRGLAGYPPGSRPPALLQPLLLAREPEGWKAKNEAHAYVLVDGEHRLRASKELGAEYVSAVIVEGYRLADVLAARIGLNHLRGELSYSTTASELREIAALNNDEINELHRLITGYAARELDVLLAATSNAPVEILGAAEEHEPAKPERPPVASAPMITIKFATADDRRIVQAWLKSMSDDPGAALLALAEKAQTNGRKKAKPKTKAERE